MATTQSATPGKSITLHDAARSLMSKTETFLNELPTAKTKDDVIALVTTYISDAEQLVASSMRALLSQQQEKVEMTGSSTLELQSDDTVQVTQMKTKIQTLVASIKENIMLLQNNGSNDQGVPVIVPSNLARGWFDLIMFSKVLKGEIPSGAFTTSTKA